MLIHRPVTLFGRTALTIGVALVLFQVVTTFVIAYYMMIPVALRSANDLTNFLLVASRDLSKLPDSRRAEYQEKLKMKTGLVLAPAHGNLPESTVYLPFVLFLGKALAEQTKQPVQTGADQRDGAQWYWVDFMSGSQRFRVGFSEHRIGVHAPPAIFLIVLLGTVLTLVSTLVMARRLTQPLSQLAAAAKRIGQGRSPEPLPEAGPNELVTLVRTFNQMAHQVETLLANRTILLAGIAHDLRTPITRMRLALEMLPPSADPEMTESMLRAMNNMTHLVNQSLEFSRGVGQYSIDDVNVGDLIGELAEDARQSGADIQWQPPRDCVRQLPPTALRRIVANLLDNAVRHGGGKSIELACVCEDKCLTVSVADRGPGIPTDELEAIFEPFYRVDKSRNSVTGGSGLGLAIAKQLADSNDWRLTIRPREGGGLVASLQIPQ
ncbi:MAG: ATP-binding protein [Thiobacillus sp.]|jgi:two-component system osmolarity sensor histidine kinase EnvZ|uniref:ATP-binding protein n=1 Tax=Thiobacillus sp. TaxID=924 RepID=UPI0028941BA6|nr:ATP-binding protein [Thiobacillus sp.]MDT3707780.1 ATP-binding protein [Thiobacillus sp.]